MGIQLVAEIREKGASYVAFTDSQAAMQRILSDAPGPGESRAAFTIRLAEAIYQRGSTVDMRWAPGHSGVEGNYQTN